MNNKERAPEMHSLIHSFVRSFVRFFVQVPPLARSFVS